MTMLSGQHTEQQVRIRKRNAQDFSAFFLLLLLFLFFSFSLRSFLSEQTPLLSDVTPTGIVVNLNGEMLFSLCLGHIIIPTAGRHSCIDTVMEKIWAISSENKKAKCHSKA